MMNIFNRIINFFFPDETKRRALLTLFLLFYFKILWFDFSWCLISTFRPFSYFETYFFAAVTAVILILPAAVFGMARTTFLLAAALGILLLSNLIYFRTYFTAIPLSSYSLLGNMSGYASSIFCSLKWTDALFPLSTLVALLVYAKKRVKVKHSGGRHSVPKYFLLLALLITLLSVILCSGGGFKKRYEKLQDSYTHTCGPPIYTVFGSVYYDYMRDREVYTPQIGEEIEEWLAGCAVPEQIPDGMPSKKNCIIILAESFESWVLEKSVENREITPYLNKLLKDSTTLFAPKVLTQVKGGRSIDAQLMINTGLLPINTGVYSLKYPDSYYPSLEKAMKEKYGGRSKSFILTADKPITWNQNVIAASFGFDTLVSKSDFVQDEKTGPHYRHQLGDISLLGQCAGKIIAGETWIGGANIVQIVTWSGHFPFALPENLKTLSFSENFPEILQDYMTVANYTDRAIGKFLEKIRSSPFYDSTLVVITGDHEGLAEMRDDVCNTETGRELVSPYPYVPLIIVNMPSLRSRFGRSGTVDTLSAAIRYDGVMGQIDIYPTLLDLLGLSACKWKGLGSSILNPDKPPLAADPHGKIYGDSTGITPALIQRLKDARHVSDKIIRHDYFRRRTSGAL